MENTILGKYRVTGVLGKGGMGAVYRAEHVLLGKLAAVKVLLPEFSSNPDIVQRFFNEAKAASSIRHPGIVEVFDYGHDDNGNAFIVMEFLDGEPLSKRLARVGRIDAVHTVRLLKQMAGALGPAHRAGITHRDLKPENIILSPDSDVAGGERVKILDFGIAKLAKGLNTSGVETRTGLALGTPTYMAPEQIRASKDVDHRADLYSLGCIGYKMLCGHPPFQSDNPYGVLLQHVSEQPSPPSIREPSIPPLVELVIMSLLAKNPAQRPGSVEALIVALDRASDPRAGTMPEITCPPASEEATEISAHGSAWLLDGHASAIEQSATTMSQAVGSVSRPQSTPSWKRRGLAALALVACTAGGGALALLLVGQSGDGDDSDTTRSASTIPGDMDAGPSALPAVDTSAFSIDDIEIDIAPDAASGEAHSHDIAASQPSAADSESALDRRASSSRRKAARQSRTRARRSRSESSGAHRPATPASPENKTDTPEPARKPEPAPKQSAAAQPKPAAKPQPAPATDCSRADSQYNQYRASNGKNKQALENAARAYELCGNIRKARMLRRMLDN